MRASIHDVLLPPSLSSLAADPAPRTTWHVKVGTLCNLRCRYCYEWDRLADRHRLTLHQWRCVFEAVRAYHHARTCGEGHGVGTTIVWHGGEPLLHPPGYVRDVLALQREVLETALPATADIRNGVQTNLTRTGETLALMVDAGFHVSASVDFAAGVRVDAAGREADDRALRNLERLVRQGARCGVAVVLGRHNHDRLESIYDTLDGMGVHWLRINAMFAPPTDAPGGDLLLAPEEVLHTLQRLYIHWLQRGARLSVHPLTHALRTVLRECHASPGTGQSPRRNVRFVVHPDGTLTGQGGTATPSERLGNIFTHRIEEVLDSPAWRSSRRRADALRDRHCTACAHVGACDGKPVLEHPHVLPAGPCPVESRLCTWIANDLAPGMTR